MVNKVTQSGTLEAVPIHVLKLEVVSCESIGVYVGEREGPSEIGDIIGLGEREECILY